MKKTISKKIIPWAGALVVRFLCGTARLQEHPRPFLSRHSKDSMPYIIAFWHSRILFTAWYFSFFPSCAIISRHSDGELAASIVEQLGLKTARGSTSKGGGPALKQLIKLIRNEGLNAGITPDGPRGPARKLQDGVITLGQLSQYPILPISFSASRAIRLKSWDRFMIPLPFSRAAFVYGEPILIPRKLKEEEKDAWRTRIENELNRITDLADELCQQPKL